MATQIEITKFENLWQAVRDLGAKGTVQLQIAKLATDGLDIPSLDDIVLGEYGLYTILPDGSIAKVVLYIADREYSSIQDGLGYPKYHIFNCHTITNMIREGRAHRYKISSRTDGKFRFVIVRTNRTETIQDQPLEVCWHCLTMYNKLLKRSESKDTFSNRGLLSDFVCSNYESELNLFRSTYKYDTDTIPNMYSSDWDKIARFYKRQREYKCEYCFWQPTDKYHYKFIHAHHINGVKNINIKDNIRILCISCHARENGHGHLMRTDDYVEFIKLKN